MYNSDEIKWTEAAIEELKRQLRLGEIELTEDLARLLGYPWPLETLDHEFTQDDEGKRKVQSTIGFDPVIDAEDYEVRITPVSDPLINTKWWKYGDMMHLYGPRTQNYLTGYNTRVPNTKFFLGHGVVSYVNGYYYAAYMGDNLQSVAAAAGWNFYSWPESLWTEPYFGFSSLTIYNPPSLSVSGSSKVDIISGFMNASECGGPTAEGCTGLAKPAFKTYDLSAASDTGILDPESEEIPECDQDLINSVNSSPLLANQIAGKLAIIGGYNIDFDIDIGTYGYPSLHVDYYHGSSGPPGANPGPSGLKTVGRNFGGSWGLDLRFSRHWELSDYEQFGRIQVTITASGGGMCKTYNPHEILFKQHQMIRSFIDSFAPYHNANGDDVSTSQGHNVAGEIEWSEPNNTFALVGGTVVPKIRLKRVILYDLGPMSPEDYGWDGSTARIQIFGPGGSDPGIEANGGYGVSNLGVPAIVDGEDTHTAFADASNDGVYAIMDYDNSSNDVDYSYNGWVTATNLKQIFLSAQDDLENTGGSEYLGDQYSTSAREGSGLYSIVFGLFPGTQGAELPSQPAYGDAVEVFRALEEAHTENGINIRTYVEFEVLTDFRRVFKTYLGSDIGKPLPERVSLSVTSGSEAIYAYWTPPDNTSGPPTNSGEPVLYYEVQINGGEIIKVEENWYYLYGAIPYMEYTVRVRAVNSVGKGAWAEGSAIAGPPAPGGGG